MIPGREGPVGHVRSRGVDGGATRCAEEPGRARSSARSFGFDVRMLRPSVPRPSDRRSSRRIRPFGVLGAHGRFFRPFVRTRSSLGRGPPPFRSHPPRVAANGLPLNPTVSFQSARSRTRCAEDYPRRPSLPPSPLSFPSPQRVPFLRSLLRGIRSRVRRFGLGYGPSVCPPPLLDGAEGVGGGTWTRPSLGQKVFGGNREREDPVGDQERVFPSRVPFLPLPFLSPSSHTDHPGLPSPIGSGSHPVVSLEDPRSERGMGDKGERGGSCSLLRRVAHQKPRPSPRACARRVRPRRGAAGAGNRPWETQETRPRRPGKKKTKSGPWTARAASRPTMDIP